MIEPKRYDLDNAYQIETPQDAARLYGDWASTYDGSFAEAWGYVAPRKIAAIFREHAGADDTPILDVGAGTGLVAAALGDLTIDAVDISEEMLAVAGGKGLYRERIVADLTQPLAIADDRYGGAGNVRGDDVWQVRCGCTRSEVPTCCASRMWTSAVRAKARSACGRPRSD